VLFRDDAGVELETRLAQPVRDFTVAEARAYCDPFVTALMNAADGEINVRLNDAAAAMAHFGREFWTREQAETVLHTALSATVYDGATWKADDTIRSAYAAADAGQASGDAGWWRAVLVRDARPAPEVDYAVAAAAVGEDEIAALLGEMLTMEEISARKPPRYMIKGLLSYDSEAWLIDGPGSKKSFVALDMAGHVARGLPWQQMKVNPGAVVFIAAEGAGGFGKRVNAWKKRNGDVSGDRMRVLPRPVQAADPAAWAVLVAACARLREALDPSLGMLIIVDTQARSTIGLDENSAKEMGVYIKAISALREATGGCVLSVHHTTKAGEVTRGSSALDGAQDTRLLMRSERGSLEAKLVVDKQKDLEQLDDIELRFEKVAVGVDADGEPMDSLVLLSRDAWRTGLFDAQSAKALEMAATPFAGRVTPAPWTFELTSADAALQRWLLQALADTAEDRGLTQSEWRGLVDEKLGKKKPTASAWRKAFQRVTSSDEKFSSVVIKIHGADRWTMDHMAIKEDADG
jgi:hypothetical protein